MAGRQVTPQSLNRYSYVLNDPVNAFQSFAGSAEDVRPAITCPVKQRALTVTVQQVERATQYESDCDPYGSQKCGTTYQTSVRWLQFTCNSATLLRDCIGTSKLTRIT